jgi:hypothetical protein
MVRARLRVVLGKLHGEVRDELLAGLEERGLGERTEN